MAGLIQNQMTSGTTGGASIGGKPIQAMGTTVAPALASSTPSSTTSATASQLGGTSATPASQQATGQLPVASTPAAANNPAGQIAGSLSTAPMTAGAEGAPGSVSQYTAEQNALAPNQTVAGNLQTILSQSSPLMTQARTQGLEQANARGLANSSIGIESAQQAVTAAALPIAQQDAQTALSVAQTNQAAANQELANNASAQNQYGLQQMAGQQSLDLATIQNNAQVQLANINNQNKLLLQADSSAGNFYNSIAQGISGILEQPNISTTDKQTLVQYQTGLLQTGLAIIGGISNIDLSGMLNFAGTALAPPAPTAAPTTQTSGVPAIGPPTYDATWQQGTWNGNIYTTNDGQWNYNSANQQWSSPYGYSPGPQWGGP